MFQDGQQLGNFEILERLGEGAMGAVYKARQTALHRLVALKTLQPVYAENHEFIVRFRGEASAAAALNHPNLVQVYSAGETDGIHWFAMEFVIGETAQERLERKGQLPAAEVAAIGVNVASALDYGWEKAQLIHRDIKPANIFLSRRGEVKLGDLGLAKMLGQESNADSGESGAPKDMAYYVSPELTQTGAAMGTPYYVSPEQALGRKDVDLRADIYSLGCTLYHLLCGQPPYAGDTSISVMSQHVHAPVPDIHKAWPQCPPAFAAVLAKAMQKSPADRYESHAEFKDALIEAYNAPLPLQPRKPASPTAWITAGAALLAAIAALIYFAPWKKDVPLSGGGRAEKEQAVPVSTSESPKKVDDNNRVTAEAAAPKDAPVAKSDPKDNSNNAPLALFTFNGTATEPGAEIKNASQHDGFLELNGVYEKSKDKDGYRVVLKTPAIDYRKFTAGVRLRPEKAGPLLIGGTGYRWLGLSLQTSGNLRVTLNNADFRQDIPGLKITLGEWVTLVVSCDLEARQVSVYVNGQSASKIALPPDFKLRVIDSNARESDKVWTFANYSNGTAFKGLVDEFVLYSTILGDEQVGKLQIGGSGIGNSTLVNSDIGKPKQQGVTGASPPLSTPSPPINPAMVSSGARMPELRPKLDVLLPDAMRGRTVIGKTKAMAENGMKPTTEEAVIKGLNWLQQNQNPDGSWGAGNKGAMTGFALLCFLGHGETSESQQFGPSVNKAVQWILDNGIKNEGRLHMASAFNQSGVYEHGICTYALGEYYTMTKDERVKELLKQAIGYIVQGQGPGGGWSYSYDKTGNDLSVSGWQIQALKVAHLSQLNIAGVDQALEKAVSYIEHVKGPKGGYGYRAASDTYSLTGVGILCQLLWTGDRAKFSKGMEWMLDETENFKPLKYGGESADLYAWYYHTQACFMFGGSAWTKWNHWFQDEIVGAQGSDGAWPPTAAKGTASSTQNGANKSSAVYRTALCTLMLEVFYRYLSPAPGPTPAASPTAVPTKGYAELTAADIAGMVTQLSKDRIDGSDGTDFWPGTYFVYRTRYGRFGKCNVDELKGHSLVLSWVTFKSEGNIHSSGHNLVVGMSYSCDLDFGLVPKGPTGGQTDFFYHGVNNATRFLEPTRAIFKVIRRSPSGK